MAEQGTFNPRVVGSIPTWLTSPHRLEAQDTALSRRRHGFESRWGHVPGAGRGAISSGVEHLPYKEGVAGSNPASPTYKLPANKDTLPTRREGREALLGPFAATMLQPE